MEYAITWGGDPEDVCFTTRGLGSLDDIAAMTRLAIADPRWRDGLNVLIDHTQSDWTAMTTEEQSALVQLLKELGPAFGQQRVAVVFRNSKDFRTGRMIGLPLDRKVPWLGHAFESLADARAWLREPANPDLSHVMPQWSSDA